MTDRDQIIEYLLRDELVYELASSIVEHETNPLELIGVVRIDDEDDSGEPTYEVWEGNRRVCAIMLLNDPEIAPARWRKRFEQLSNRVEFIEDIEGRVFEDHDELRFWMRNIHNGTQGGQGRKDWGPDEQHRDNPTKKNAVAFALLELAEAKGYITTTERKGTLTTLQRYVGKPDARKILGADDSDPAEVKFGRRKRELNKLLKLLIADLLDGTISSRKNEDEIVEYLATLEARAGLEEEGDDDDDEGGEGGGGEGGGGGDGDDDDDDDDEDEPADKPARPPSKIKRSGALAKAVNRSKNAKLIELYKSLTQVSAKTNTQLIAVGVWAFIETITQVCGAAENMSFVHFFSNDKLAKLGETKEASKRIRQAFVRLSEGGNATKHDAISATFDHRSVINDMERVSPTLAKALNAQDFD